MMDDLRFYVLFNSISVISGRWEVDNERLCAMEYDDYEDQKSNQVKTEDEFL